MKFAIIIPVYNKAPYVEKSLGSVLGQTYRDFELMVIDNGSTDGSGEKIAAFQDPRLRVCRYDENMGAAAARNKGVEMTTAPYVVFLDADDWWEETFLEEMEELIARHPHAGIYGTGYYIVKNGKRRIAPIGIQEGFSEGIIDYCSVYAKTLCMPLTSSSVCIPRHIFKEMGGFPPQLDLGEDFLLWIHIALNYPVALLSKSLSNYNQDANPAYRATQNLIDPQRHMLWNLGDLESLEESNKGYKQLVDNLRTYMLMTYVVKRRYRSAARRELEKVDWHRQAPRERRLYSWPWFILSLRYTLLCMASRVKRSLTPAPTGAERGVNE